MLCNITAYTSLKCQIWKHWTNSKQYTFCHNTHNALLAHTSFAEFAFICISNNCFTLCKAKYIYIYILCGYISLIKCFILKHIDHHCVYTHECIHAYIHACWGQVLYQVTTCKQHITDYVKSLIIITQETNHYTSYIMFTTHVDFRGGVDNSIALSYVYICIAIHHIHIDIPFKFYDTHMCIVFVLHVHHVRAQLYKIRIVCVLDMDYIYICI